ncbi:MAG TPA: BMP family ABC transporter substrate-binding protein [Clostridiales bacterium]|nr:BMP family ABC transporter substrate-binding protein [Clostridiales bacterium]
MKKLLVVLLAVGMLFSFAACGGEEAVEPTTFELALVTDVGTIDDKSFNQGTWEGLKQYAEENSITYKYYQPTEQTDAAYLDGINLAIAGGAKVVVCPGYLFGPAVTEAAKANPDISFIVIDTAPTEECANVYSISYAEEQSGYLAGYAAVKDGFTKLGFMGGMAVPAVRAFGYGFLQGAEAAAKDMNLSDGALTVTYHYTGNFDENDTNKATAATMYQQGVEVIFACGGSVGKSVMAAAAEANKKVIGVDVDQRYDSPTVITSATKGLAPSIIAALESVYINKNFSEYAGKTTTFEAKNKGVGLPTTVIGVTNGNAFDRFTSFNKDAYDTVFATLANDTVNPIRDITVAAETGYATADELKTGLSLVKVVPTVR